MLLVTSDAKCAIAVVLSGRPIDREIITGKIDGIRDVADSGPRSIAIVGNTHSDSVGEDRIDLIWVGKSWDGPRVSIQYSL